MSTIPTMPIGVEQFVERRPDYPYAGTAIVAFLDLLGFTERLRETWNTPSNVLDLLLQLKVDASNAFGQAGWYNTVIDGGGAATTYLYPYNVISISDSIVLRVVAEDGKFGTPGGAEQRDIYGAFCAVKTITQFVIARAAELGFGLRGGIEFGDIYMTATETIGPSFLDAYYLETKAKSARVVIGPQLCEHLQHHPAGRLRLNDDIYVCADSLLAVHPGDASLIGLRNNAPTKVKAKYDEVISAQGRPIGESLPPRGWLLAAEAATSLMCAKS